MNFNIRKCNVLQCYRTNSPILANYSLAGQILECVKEYFYLGIILDQQKTFTSHINHIVSKASKVLNFLKRNLHKYSTSTKATAYISLVRPILEYASSVWDPYQYNKIYIIARIQCRAARWSLCNYDRYSSVTLMQHQLYWQNLQRQKIARLSLLYKALYDHIALQVQGRIQDFFKGGLRDNGYIIYKNYIYIAIIHIILINKVHVSTYCA